ncbi:YHYH domain-containing protein [Roseateles sp. BYS180W]|uniref:YHYH domain-containing protein n=2 Tax=Roseateles rivi TaxID=3299028 RepID=A0ABW7FSP9_9BURK
MLILKISLATLLVAASINAFAHGGGVNAEGCHTNKKTGDYHCHGGKSKSEDLSAGQKMQPKNSSPSASNSLPPGCYVGPRGGTYTLTKSGRKNYGGC